MSKDEFDEYRDNYVQTVEQSVGFSGLKHSFFQESKSHKIADIVHQKLSHVDQPKLLDVGCGVGALHPYIEHIFHQIDGVDVSTESIEQARIDNPTRSYADYGGLRLPYDDNSFDMTLAVCVMHHVPTQHWENFLAEKARVVRPGGIVCLIEHNPYNPATRLSVARCPFDADAVLLSGREMKKRLSAAELTDVCADHFVFMPSNNSTVRAVERRLGWIPLGAQYIATGVVK
jgi:SAM-dependent methyltransferase